MTQTTVQFELFGTDATPVEQSVTRSGRFGDFVVYVDESGDHSLTSIDDTYPVFVLAFCIFHKRYYAEQVIPAIEKFKFNHFGHDSVVLHEHEIRKQKGIFAFLSHTLTRESFYQQLNHLLITSHFVLIACVVDKRRLPRMAGNAANPYHVALGECLSGLRDFLDEKKQLGRTTHIVVECRGKKEDTDLELEFRRLCDEHKFPFEMVFADKRTNSAGLQIADLVARPVGIHTLRPAQDNRSFDILKPKFFCAGGRQRAGEKYLDIGLRIRPVQKAKSPDDTTEAVTPARTP